MNLTRHIDYDALNALKEIMEDDFGFLIETFIEDSNDRVQKLCGLASAPDTDAIRRIAHSFKGSCSNLGAVRLAVLCFDLEQNALNQKFESLPEDIADIEQEFLIIKQMMLDFLD